MNKPAKILIIRFSSIGDIVLTTPVIRCLKQQLSGAEIHYVVKKKFRQVLEHNPYIDRLHFFDDNLKELIRVFRAERFDYVIDLHKTIRSYLLRWALQRKTLTFRKLSVEKWLMNNFHIDLLPKDLHIVERNLASVLPLGVLNDGKPVDYFVGPEDEVFLTILPESHRSGFIAFVIGGQHFTKRLPVEKIITICRETARPMVLLGGPEDMVAAAEVLEHAGSHVISLCGKLSLNQSVSLLRQSTLVMAHDTGLMHISGAFDKPVISIWGSTSHRHFGVWPYLSTDSYIAEINGLPCRPCTNFGLPACPQKHFKCMLLHNDQLIAETAKQKFDRHFLPPAG
ncbi:heptosyltransferase-2 [Anseongella ginsenosidimutans]|uniref:Heptosyltransferase-2 n=1 Tax=Anseongella ginsenosidimutans TaxID=496056 RepID=A0A4R3KNE9_9SPHI|nr:glycosyltransferase family 9 protein [Anseongella ginsenosidimutans]QEC53714.1 glycosyltransferase family 9 protein [Anseongella ginsenosidimutans]TCS86035.1 heptosyltransferase-2 [Anseongella ginsenosidimutans]